MQSFIVAALIGLASAAVPVTFYNDASGYGCGGSQVANTALTPSFCMNIGEFNSLVINPVVDGSDPSGCYVETYGDSNCQIFQARIGPLSNSASPSGCVGSVPGNEVGSASSFTAKLVC